MTTTSSCTERARRKRRGAALVESVIVVSMLAMCMVAFIGVRSLYLAKIQASSSARELALSQAMRGCGVMETGLESAKSLLKTLAHQFVDFDVRSLVHEVFGANDNLPRSSNGTPHTARFQRSSRDAVTTTTLSADTIMMPCVVKPTECCANIDFYSLLGLGDDEEGSGSW